MSQVYRDYPHGRHRLGPEVSGRWGLAYWSQDSLTLDVAYIHGSWERATPSGYKNTTDYFPTVATREKVSQDRVFASTTFHFE